MKKYIHTLAMACFAAFGATQATAQDNDVIPGPEAPFEIDQTWKGAWQLRGAFVPPSTAKLEEPTRAQLAKILQKSPFIFSFERDEISNQTTLGLKGALFYTWARDVNDASDLKIQSYALGVEIDQGRIDGVTSKDVLKFQGRKAALFGNSDVDTWITSQFIDAGIGYVTNSDFDLSVVSFDAKYTPYNKTLWNFRSKVGFPLKITPQLRFEAQTVLDDAGVVQFQGDADRFYAGGNLNIEAGFGPNAAKSLQRISFGMDYTHMFDLTGAGDDRDLLDAKVTWALAEDSAASWNLGYTKGQSTTGKEVDKLTLGLGFAF